LISLGCWWLAGRWHKYQTAEIAIIGVDLILGYDGGDAGIFILLRGDYSTILVRVSRWGFCVTISVNIHGWKMIVRALHAHLS
jgi:hypothetical protein